MLLTVTMTVTVTVTVTEARIPVTMTVTVTKNPITALRTEAVTATRFIESHEYHVF